MSSLNTNLNGKVAVVTGAASGIGKQIALTLSAAGAAIAIADLNQDGANAVAEEIRQAGGKAIGIAMDVTNEDAVNQGIDKVAAELGSIDILISNAGIQIVNPIENYSFSDWKKMQAIHVDGAFLTTKAALKHELTPIVCIGEGLDVREAGDHVAYNVAQLKGSLAGLSAAEIAQTVIAYEPVWAIGTGKSATSAQAQAVHAFLRARLAAKGAAVADVPVLYGGSVKPENAEELFREPDIDGGLIGGALGLKVGRSGRGRRCGLGLRRGGAAHRPAAGAGRPAPDGGWTDSDRSADRRQQRLWRQQRLHRRLLWWRQQRWRLRRGTRDKPPPLPPSAPSAPSAPSTGDPP